MSEEKLEALRIKVEQQEAELKKLRDQINPPKSEPYVMPRFDPTEGMSMPRSAMQAMIDASSSYMADLRADARRPNPVTEASSSTVRGTPTAQSQPQRGTGWRDEIPLSSPPGVELADRLMDHQDAKDRAELIERELKLAKMGKGDVG